jgi:cystathionine beta-lyase/cystathionine gamma-synthase
MSHASMPLMKEKDWALRSNLIRVSVGLEETNDLIADFARVLKSIKFRLLGGRKTFFVNVS